jgi:hypothetical protein
MSAGRCGSSECAIQISRHPIAAHKRRSRGRQTYLQGENFGQKAAGWIPGWLDALIGVGILGEKTQLLGGDATARIEVNANIDFHAELTHFLEEAEQKVAMIKQVRAIEIGVDGENLEQKALTNGDHEWPCDAQNGAGNVDLEASATLVADERNA